MGGSCGKSRSAVADEAAAKIGAGTKGVEDSVVLKLSENQLEEFRECFNAFDKDGGGSIDSEELEALMKSLGQEPNEKELKKMVALADIDGSGDIDFAEFVVLIAHKMKDDDNELKEGKLVDAFKVFDADGNGVIDSHEMRRIMYNLGEEMSLRDVDECIRSYFDKDGDSNISPEEFAKALLTEKLMGTAAMA